MSLKQYWKVTKDFYSCRRYNNATSGKCAFIPKYYTIHKWKIFICLLNCEEYKQLYRSEALFTITVSADATHSFLITPYQPAITRVARGIVQKDQSGIKRSLWTTLVLLKIVYQNVLQTNTVRPKFGYFQGSFTYRVWFPPPPRHCDRTRAMVSLFLRFLDRTQWRTTLGRTPLDEWSAHRRDLYLPWQHTTFTTDIHAAGGIRAHSLSRRAALGSWMISAIKNISNTYSARSLVNTYKFCWPLNATVWCVYVPVRLTVNFPGRWIGCQGPTMATANFPILLLVIISFCWVGPKRKSTDQNQEHLMNWNNRFEIPVPLFLLSCWRKSVESASCRLQNCAQNTGAYAKIWHWSASVWALKWSKSCCTSPFRFSIHWFNTVFTNHSACAITYFGCSLFLASRYVKETLKNATRRRNVSRYK